MTTFDAHSHDELIKFPIPLREGLLEKQVVLISGGGSGLGRATAYCAARLGARVALCGRRLEKLEETKSGLNKLGADVFICSMTIRDQKAVTDLIDAVWSRFGGLDVLVNNAGGQFPQSAIDYSTKGWLAVIDTNLNGTWYMMQSAARRWRDAQRPGCIVNVTASVMHGSPGTAHTAAARAAVWNLTKSLATEWAHLNIRVNGIAPGLMRTEGLNQYAVELIDKHLDSNPMHRYSHPAEVANAICFLACRGADFINGETLVMDGGGQNYGVPWSIPRDHGPNTTGLTRST